MILITHAARNGDQAFPVFIFSYLKPLSAVGELSAEFIAIDNVVVGVQLYIISETSNSFYRR